MITRPAYLDEYEKLENELKEMYSVYVQKFRNLAYLEHVYNEYDRLEQERSLVRSQHGKAPHIKDSTEVSFQDAEMNMRKIAEKMREEERAKLAIAEKIDVSAAMGSDFEEKRGLYNKFLENVFNLIRLKMLCFNIRFEKQKSEKLYFN